MPNAGKSTLMNALMGDKLSIITAKAQTTRHRIMGFINGKDYQIIYSDTPGILKPHYRLHKSMMRSVEEAFEDADIFLLIIDILDKDIDDETVSRLNATDVPVLIVINKIDLSSQPEVEASMESWKQRIPAAEVMPASALHGFNIEKIFSTILEKLPESPPYFPKDEFTNKSMRFFVSEIVREKIFSNYHQEIPYSTEVIVEEYKEDKDIIRIRANIFVARDSQKAIILGKEGKAIKKTGIDARKDIEDFAGKKVFLELRVKVAKDWRNDERQLKWFGYE